MRTGGYRLGASRLLSSQLVFMLKGEDHVKDIHFEIITLVIFLE